MNFIAPSFLFGLSAIAIPIIIHLIELRRARKILFTNVAFIREVKNITSSHRRIKHYLILLARIGFISFFVLCFAQPFIPKQSQSITNKNVKVYLDNSFSLQNESEQSGKNLLDISLDHARGLISNLNSSTIFNFIENSNKSNIHSDFTSVKSKERLEQINFSSAYKTSEVILSSLQGADAETFEGFYYSDFQKKSFNPDGLKNLGADNNFYLVHLKGEAKHNAYIDSIYLEDEFIRVNQINKLRVKVRNSGDQNIDNCQVKFFIDNEQISALNINIPAKQTSTFSLNYRLSDKELKNCRVTLQDFPVEFDNTYYFTLKAAESISIVEVSDAGNSAINRLYTNEPLFSYQTIKPQQFNYALLKGTNLIILNNLSSVTSAFAENLRNYISKGGNVIYIPAANSEAKTSNDFFKKLGSGNIQKLVVNANTILQNELALPDANNPFFKNIFESRSNKMVMPKAARVLAWQQSSVDILKFKNGTKYLSGFNNGLGKLYVFASPLQDDYSDFASHAFFVPVMYKLALQSYSQEQQLAYTLGGNTIQFPASTTKAKDVFKLVKDSVSFIPEQNIRNGVAYLSIPDEINEAGFYNLLLNDKKITEFAFNYNKRESDLETYSVNELKKMVGDAKNIKVLDATDEVSVKKLFSESNLGTQLWKYCLILCLVFILTEILLIRFM